MFNAESMVLLSLLLLLLLLNLQVSRAGITTLVQTCANFVLTRCLFESQCANTLNLVTNLMATPTIMWCAAYTEWRLCSICLHDFGTCNYTNL
jgi:hypothetical protein